MNDGGPAFPTICQLGNAQTGPDTGMSLRDWFAGQAIAPYMNWQLGQPVEDGDTKEIAAARYAKTAYVIADAMIAEREKGGSK